MGLSEREQQILDEIETALMQDGPIRVRDPKSRKFVTGALIAVLGLGIMLTAVILAVPPLGVFAFITMLTGVLMSIDNLPLRR